MAHERIPLGASDAAAQPFAWLQELVGFFRRNIRLLSASTASVTLLALIYVATATPQFMASTILLIDLRQVAPFQQHPPVVDAQIENAMIESEVEVLRSAGLARKVVAALNLTADPNFVGRSSALARGLSGLRARFTSGTASSKANSDFEDRVVQQFLRAVSVHRIGLTYIIEIDATAKDRNLAARLANGLTTAYLAEQLVVRNTSTQQAAMWQEGRLAQLQDQALKADQQVQRFKSTNGIVDTGHGLLNEQQLTELNSQLVAARGRTAEASAALDRIRQMTRKGSDPGMAVTDVLKSPVINGLRERYLNDATRVAGWSSQYGHDSGPAIMLRKEMAQLQVSINSEIRRIEQATESDLVVDRAGEAAIQAQLDKLVSQSASTDTARATFRSLQSSADTYRSLYVAFLQQTMQADQADKYPVADARVVTQARPPLTKSKPQAKLILAAAIVLGLVIGFVIAILQEALDRRLRNPAGLLADTGLSCIATLPDIGAAPPSFLPKWPRRHGFARTTASPPFSLMENFVATNPDAPFTMGMRRLQLRLLQQQADKSGIIGLVAPSRGAGTSTVAANLVKLLQASGHDAVLLPLPGEAGLQPGFRHRIETLHRDHAFVVVDFPALDRPVEAHTVFPDIGLMVLLLEAGSLDGGTLLEQLRYAGLDRRSIMGVVLNRVPVDP
ncbi:GumC family protein [Lichenicola cladoniae]|uniref:GumC family protein n=1 Tax=Lichenicola cladoniae TaxID=1484109 RepID=A0A6M8H7T1_9PROT|nr:GumC family protein [Lichenicola cladoniae]NPD65159.1 GumC family protein [Acetobacteraceae bacterium]QKE88763.1 GumC family protein [Lichenicola cladoniae]